MFDYIKKREIKGKKEEEIGMVKCVNVADFIAILMIFLLISTGNTYYDN